MKRSFGFAALAAACTLPAPAGDWSRFRGPNGTGVGDAGTPIKWSKTENVLWTAPLAPGKAHSSPIVIKGRVFVQTSPKDASKRTLVCLDATTGREKWAKDAPGHAGKIHPQKGSFASSTAASDGERVFTCFWDGDAVTLAAYDLNGKDLWTASLGSFESQHGAGMSPVVHAGKVFVNFDQDGAAEIVAYDAKTGDRVWAKPRKPYRACYSTPIVRERKDGKSEVIVYSTLGATGYNPDNGDVNWEWVIPWKPEEMALRSVASPVLAGSLLICVNGDGSGARYSMALDLDAPGGPKPAWEKRSKALTPYVPCPVVKGEYVYWITDQGMAECIEAKTGEVKWSERAFNSKGVSASPVMIGDVILAIDEPGKAVAWKADPSGFEIVAKSDVGEAVFATPAVADGKLFIRGADQVICVGKK
jgi:outer membrane protein assembly factor BamB